MVTVWPAASEPVQETVVPPQLVKVPATLAMHVPAMAGSCASSMAVKVALCGLGLGLVTCAVTPTMLPGPVQTDGSWILRIKPGGGPLTVVESWPELLLMLVSLGMETVAELVMLFIPSGVPAPTLTVRVRM